MEQVNIFITRPDWSKLNLDTIQNKIRINIMYYIDITIQTQSQLEREGEVWETYSPHRIASDKRTQLIYVVNGSMLTSSISIFSVTGEYTIALCEG